MKEEKARNGELLILKNEQGQVLGHYDKVSKRAFFRGEKSQVVETIKEFRGMAEERFG